MTSKQPLFSSEEIQENELKKAKLANLLRSGDAILMAGAGCTASIYPDWQGFVNLLNIEARLRDKEFEEYRNGDDFLSFADRVKDCIGNEAYYNLIYRSFREKEKTHEKYHEALCTLLVNKRFRGITTTNYDPVFENAMVAVTGRQADAIWIDSNIEQARIFEFFLSLNEDSTRRRILHIHGICHQKDSIILSKSEYEAKYGFKLRAPAVAIWEAIRQGEMNEKEFSALLNDYGLAWTIHRKILWSLFSTRRLVFLGFSLNDPYFNKMLEFVSSDLHTYGYEVHYLILRIRRQEEKLMAKAKANQLLEKFGIQTIFFEETESGKGLENFIFEMERAVEGDSKQQITAEREIRVVNDLEGDEELTTRLIELSRNR